MGSQSKACSNLESRTEGPKLFEVPTVFWTSYGQVLEWIHDLGGYKDITQCRLLLYQKFPKELGRWFPWGKMLASQACQCEFDSQNPRERLNMVVPIGSTNTQLLYGRQRQDNCMEGPGLASRKHSVGQKQ